VQGQTLTAGGELVSGNYFEVLGAMTELGRPLVTEDDRLPGARPVAVISGSFWKRRFASDPAIVGRTIVLNGHAFSIIGVAAPGFTGTDVGLPTDIWIPLAMQREVGRDLLTDARTNWLEMVGRLRAGDTRERAAEALNREFQGLTSERRLEASVRQLVLEPADRGSSPARGEQKTELLVTFALTGLALALAAVNIAGLAAVRSAARDKEMAIRLAIGAGRSRLDRQLLTEGLVLAALGGLAALLIMPWTARALIIAYSPQLATELTLDLPDFMFVGLTSVLAGVSVALVPILASRPRVQRASRRRCGSSRTRPSWDRVRPAGDCQRGILGRRN
jgi:hypothetical protein